MLLDPARLTPDLVQLLDATPREYLMVSALALYEISIKVAKGRLALDAAEVATELDRLGLPSLPFLGRHAVRAGQLPPIHQDPFDRGMIAQAQLEGLSLITSDRLLSDYPVPTLIA
jgi:PIN domain nuclease of toxin-antitoxin system